MECVIPGRALMSGLPDISILMSAKADLSANPESNAAYCMLLDFASGAARRPGMTRKYFSKPGGIVGRNSEAYCAADDVADYASLIRPTGLY
jgi:hypothetical protein